MKDSCQPWLETYARVDVAQVLAWPWKAPLLNWFEFGLVTLLGLLQTTTPSFQERCEACLERSLW